jgi:hypothetical protein
MPAAEGGGSCTSAALRLVGDRAGRLNFTLHTLDDPPDLGCLRSGKPAVLSRERPLDSFATSGPEQLEEGGDPQLGRIARRTLPGLTIITGTAHPDVVTVTIVTPSDIRTLTPTGRTHAFLAVYDGTFPGGGLELIAEFADGTTKTMPVLGLPL